MKNKMFLVFVILLCLAVTFGCTAATGSAGRNSQGEDEKMVFVEVKTDDMVEFPRPIYNARPYSSIHGYPIKLKHSDEDAVFECSVDKGDLGKEDPYYPELETGKNIIAKSGEGDGVFSIVWFNDGTVDSSQDAFIEIILKINSNIIGYAVVKVNDDENLFTGRLLHSALIPQIDGEYQAVTEEQVKTAIEKAKTKK